MDFLMNLGGLFVISSLHHEAGHYYILPLKIPFPEARLADVINDPRI